ncbi:MAG: permease [Hyphomonas sp.]|uniref:permease n=1 Tax=Hyphomonas sp. TaxID=87 RepID=UPI00184855FA|nr:permease [Hyphomonas sp.]MBA3067771.1 permease [Hyphomonas sp.]MBU3919753.1 permease [Alphaproteobacteria bacterium]MBU4062141.1 permease [Alphaproteobacteria bacterium]MBU4165576.1 permease [Alphaproteobacteria bacterium]
MSAPSEVIEQSPTTQRAALWIAGLAVFLAGWWVIYTRLIAFSEWLVSLLPVARESHFGEALAFFFYDTPKVLMLLTLIVFAMGVIRTYFSPERTRALLSGKREGVGNVMAAGLGVLTPFCSCSAVPLFIGFVSAGVPLGVTFSFLIAAPMVNEVALGLLFGLVGWQVALTYLAFGLTLAVVAGWVIGRLKLEGWLQDWVKEISINSAGNLPEEKLTFVDRLKLGIEAVREIVAKVWIWILFGIGMGAAIHGFVPQDLMVRIMSADAWWSVPAAILLGIPMYTNAAGVIPIVEALLGKGAALGTTLAFMMSVIALSLPEMIILRKVLTLKLIGVFVGVVASGILVVGFLFNLIF